MNNVIQLFSNLWAQLKVLFVFSKTLIFIWGFIVSFVLFDKGVVYLFSGYLSYYFDGNLRITAILGNLREGLSSLFVIAIHISKSYAGGFNTIIFCTAASVIGVLLLWISELISQHSGVLYVSLILIALGYAKKSTLHEFLKYQLEQSLNPGSVKRKENSTQKRLDTAVFNKSTYFWWYSAWIPGYLLALLWLSHIYYWSDYFKYAALVMGTAYMWFYCGCFCYSFKELDKSPLFKIYEVFRAAWSNSKLEYPTSKEKYYWKNITQTERDSYMQSTSNSSSQIRLKPIIGWSCLDKAAIIKDLSSDANSQEINGELCPVKQVSEVKLVASMTHFVLVLFPYCLVRGAESTFFLLQTDNMKYHKYILVLSLIQSFTCRVVANSFKWLNLTGPMTTVVRIGLGMVCSVVCCFVAWWVENYTRNLTVKEGILEDPNKNLSISIAILLPQYLLLGLAAGLAEKGYEELFRINHVPESMLDSVEPLIAFVFLLGSILTMLLVYLITPWFEHSLNTSQLGAYYLMLAIMNFVALLIYVFFSRKYIYEGGHTENENETNTGHGSYSTQGDSDHATAGTSTSVHELVETIEGGAATVLGPTEENTDEDAIRLLCSSNLKCFSIDFFNNLF